MMSLGIRSTPVLTQDALATVKAMELLAAFGSKTKADHLKEVAVAEAAVIGRSKDLDVRAKELRSRESDLDARAVALAGAVKEFEKQSAARSEAMDTREQKISSNQDAIDDEFARLDRAKQGAADAAADLERAKAAVETAAKENRRVADENTATRAVLDERLSELDDARAQVEGDRQHLSELRATMTKALG